MVCFSGGVVLFVPSFRGPSFGLDTAFLHREVPIGLIAAHNVRGIRRAGGGTVVNSFVGPVFALKMAPLLGESSLFRAANLELLQEHLGRGDLIGGQQRGLVLLKLQVNRPDLQFE